MDFDPEELRPALHRAADWVADYLAGVGAYPVLSQARPGDLTAKLPASPPLQGEPLDRLLDDFESLILPGITHWQHPRFFAYFGITGSAPGILAELLCAGLNVNAMLWRTSPAATELEEVTTGWLREAIGLPPSFRGVINDTASSSTLYALAGAREAVPGLEVRRRGITRSLRFYTSAEAHSSVEKAGLTLGVGSEGVVKIPVDGEFRMEPAALERAIAADRAAGHLPFAVVGTVGTTSTTSIDPIPALAAICEREELWLHVDAAYGGAAAILESQREILAGCERADSVVVNPHKWLFTPIDCSVLYCRREDVLKRAFSVVPDYLASADGEVRNLMDFGNSLGRRFRSLKLWFVMRAFGLDGARERIARHIEWAQELRRWLEADPDFEVLAPSPFSTVVFRWKGGDALNQAIEDAVNSSGEAFISHTTVRGAYALRIAIGNLRTTRDDVRAVYELVRSKARSQTSYSRATSNPSVR